jgi:glycosyltransferase involved in cell wall biosynthesis
MMVMLALAHGLRARRFDIVIATSPPLFVGVSGWMVALLGRVPLVLEVRDRWPQQAMELGIIKHPLVIRLAEGLERFLYRQARMVVVVTASASRAVTRAGASPHKVVIVPNGADCERLHPCDDRGGARTRLGWGRNLTASYIGTMGLSQGLSVVVEAAREVKERGVPVQVVIVGDGADREAISRLASISSVRLSDPVDPDRVAELYAATDIGIVVLRNLPLFAGTVPSKLYEYMACGIPVIAGVRGETAAIVEEAGAGLVVQPDDPMALADAIQRLATDGEARVKMGSAGRRWVKVYRDRRTLADRYLDRLLALSA